MKIIIGGALGRMGTELAKAAVETGIEIVCGVDVAYAGQARDFTMVAQYADIDAQADVLVDFSRADGLYDLLKYALKAQIPLVLCTTGYTEEEQASIAEAAKSIAVLRSANMSIGVHVMRQLAMIAAHALGDRYDVEIVEKHHRMKLDSPSGTAVMLYDAIKQVREGEGEAVYGRHGRSQKRTQQEIGIHAVRGGTVTGEHEVGFYGNAEEILITHRAESRILFAEGALRAAQFLAGKAPGQYTMQDVVAEIIG